MKVLLIGSGGREHALMWKLSKNPKIKDFISIPGNGGMDGLGKSVSLDLSNIFEIADFAQSNDVDFTIVGPEVPLVEGIVDCFTERGLLAFGPSREAARLEGSKSFAKMIMEKYRIPTGKAATFTSYEPAKRYIESISMPTVVKADGLAAGKGVTVCFEKSEAINALRECFIDNRFGKAGETVIVEEYLEGEEVSLLVFTDGKDIIPLHAAQDYKRIFDGDKGPNTGGMGCYSPVPFVNESLIQEILEKVIEPTVFGMQKEGCKYRGILYTGLILTEKGLKVLEYNCRFGDPETQVLLPLMKSDLLEIMRATVDGSLKNQRLEWEKGCCITLVLASKGYPGKYQTGIEISGIEEASKMDDVFVFQAGTKLSDGKVLTNGGRVLNVSAVGTGYKQAREKAYQAAAKIDFKGKYNRTDIGLKAVKFSGGEN